MFGSASGSFGSSTRKPPRLSAVISKGRAPSRAGSAPSPGTRTVPGSQHAGNREANSRSSSMTARNRGRGLSLVRRRFRGELVQSRRPASRLAHSLQDTPHARFGEATLPAEESDHLGV